MGVAPREFRYFLARPGGRAPLWISLAQWFAFGLWLLFSWWAFWGSGSRFLLASFRNYHGVYAQEVTLRVSILPNWALISIALVALCLWFQGLWIRCGVVIGEDGEGWVWRGLRGPRAPERIIATLGGAWLGERGRWFFVPAGFVDAGGEGWFSVLRVERGPLLHWRRVASPLSLLLALLLLGAYLAESPTRAYRRHRAEVYGAFERRDRAALEALVAARPEFRPWARYLSTLPACDRAECLRSQVTDRLEILSIGPFYGADDSTLIYLLVLSGRTRMAQKLLRPESGAAFDAAVRMGECERARKILASSTADIARKRSLSYLLLLLQEGRFGEAEAWSKAYPDRELLDLVAVKAAIADLNGRCDEANRMAAKLLSPDSLPQATIESEPSLASLGALRRVVRAAKNRGYSALAYAVLGDMSGARAAWREAVGLAAQAGTPGATDRARILLDLVSPGGPWSH